MDQGDDQTKNSRNTSGSVSTSDLTTGGAESKVQPDSKGFQRVPSGSKRIILTRRLNSHSDKSNDFKIGQFDSKGESDNSNRR